MTTTAEATYLFRVVGEGISPGAFLVGTPALVTALVSTFYPNGTAVPVREVTER